MPFGFGTRTPGLGGLVKGLLGEMRWYSACMRAMPSWPLLPPPKVVGTEIAFAFSSFLRWCSVSNIGSAQNIVRTRC